MTHDEAFLNDICQKPDDDAPRLTYADWIEKQGDPERAEFIRVQVALARNTFGMGHRPAAEIARLLARERALLSRNEDRWLRPLRDLNAVGSFGSEFNRGFVENVSIDATTFVEKGEDLWRVTPVRVLYLSEAGRIARRLSRCPYLARVRHLEFDDELTFRALRTILESPYLSGLQGLWLSELSMSDEAVLALAWSSVMRSLRELSLIRTSITGSTLPSLLERLPRLESFSLFINPAFEGERLAEVLAALNPACLRELEFHHVPLGTAGIRALAKANPFPGLTKLALRDCLLDNASIKARD